MGALLLRIAIRVALCAGATWLMYRSHGAIAFALCAPLFGVALARPLIDLFAEMQHSLRAQALAGLQGRNYEHQGRRIDITEDDEGRRWLATADVRRIVAGLPRDEVLQRMYPEGVAADAGPQRLRIRADTLHEQLRGTQDPDAVRFKVWLDRVVVFPSRPR